MNFVTLSLVAGTPQKVLVQPSTCFKIVEAPADAVFTMQYGGLKEMLRLGGVRNFLPEPQQSISISSTVTGSITLAFGQLPFNGEGHTGAGGSVDTVRQVEGIVPASVNGSPATFYADADELGNPLMPVMWWPAEDSLGQQEGLIQQQTWDAKHLLVGARDYNWPNFWAPGSVISVNGFMTLVLTFDPAGSGPFQVWTVLGAAPVAQLPVYDKDGAQINEIPAGAAGGIYWVPLVGVTQIKFVADASWAARAYLSPVAWVPPVQ